MKSPQSFICSRILSRGELIYSIDYIQKLYIAKIDIRNHSYWQGEQSVSSIEDERLQAYIRKFSQLCFL